MELKMEIDNYESNTSFKRKHQQYRACKLIESPCKKPKTINQKAKNTCSISQFISIQNRRIKRKMNLKKRFQNYQNKINELIHHFFYLNIS